MLSIEDADAAQSQARRMVSLARLDPAQPVVVLGPGAMSLMIDLCREGRQQVVCGCRAGLPCALEHSSTVLVGGPVTDDELATLLGDACSVLGFQGRLVVSLANIDQDRVVEARLARLGVRITSAVYDLSREVLVCHELERACGVVERRLLAA